MYRFLHILITILSHIPFWMLYIISDIIYFPVYYIGRYRRKVVRSNLESALPELSHKEIVKIEKGFYHFFIDMALESVKFYTLSEKEIRKRMVFKNTELMNEKLRSGKSVSIYLGHYGNWEWIASLGLWLDNCAEHVQIYHRLNNEAMDKVIRNMRGRFGSHNVEMDKTVRFIADELREGKSLIIGFIADQSPRRKDSKYFLPFLNHEVPVLTGTEKLTSHFGFESVYGSMKRIKRGYYECTFSPMRPAPGEYPEFPLTNLYFKLLEQDIRRQPELYLWSHKRFRYAKEPATATTNPA